MSTSNSNKVMAGDFNQEGTTTTTTTVTVTVTATQSAQERNNNNNNSPSTTATSSSASAAATTTATTTSPATTTSTTTSTLLLGAQAAPIHHERTPYGRPQSWTLQHGRSLSSNSGLLLAAAASSQSGASQSVASPMSRGASQSVASISTTTTTTTTAEGATTTAPPPQQQQPLLLIPPKRNNMQRGSTVVNNTNANTAAAMAATTASTNTTNTATATPTTTTPRHKKNPPPPPSPTTTTTTTSLLPLPGRIRSASLGRAMSFGTTVLQNPYPRSNSVAAALSPRFWNHKRVHHHNAHHKNHHHHSHNNHKNHPHHTLLIDEATARAQTKRALQINDGMIYLDGPHVYACQQCRTHLTSHDDVISKSFHGRNGRAYLLDEAVNCKIGPPEDRMLMTGLHSVCDLFCKRCQTLIGWTYQRAYEPSQKYKEGKFIIEKINLYLEQQQEQEPQDEGAAPQPPLFIKNGQVMTLANHDNDNKNDGQQQQPSYWRGGRGGGGAAGFGSQCHRRRHKPRSQSWGSNEYDFADPYQSFHNHHGITPPSPPLTNRRIIANSPGTATAIVYEYPPGYSPPPPEQQQEEESTLALPPSSSAATRGVAATATGTE